MGGEPGDSQEEPDDEVGPDRGVCREPDTANERGNAECSEDEPDGPAEQPDQSTRHDRCEPGPVCVGRGAELEEQVEAAPGQDGRDEREQQPAGDDVREVAAGERPEHGGRGHPGHDAPAHAPRAGVRQAPGERRDSADGDVRPGRRRGAPGRE